MGLKTVVFGLLIGLGAAAASYAYEGCYYAGSNFPMPYPRGYGYRYGYGYGYQYPPAYGYGGPIIINPKPAEEGMAASQAMFQAFDEKARKHQDVERLERENRKLRDEVNRLAARVRTLEGRAKDAH